MPRVPIRGHSEMRGIRRIFAATDPRLKEREGKGKNERKGGKERQIYLEDESARN